MKTQGLVISEFGHKLVSHAAKQWKITTCPLFARLKRHRGNEGIQSSPVAMPTNDKRPKTNRRTSARICHLLSSFILHP